MGWFDSFDAFFDAISTSFAPVVVSAATQAAYGAAIGAGIAAIAGGDVGKGALYGAGTGAVTGGLSGAFGQPSDPLGILDQSTAPSQASAGNVIDKPGTLATMGDEDFLAGFDGPDAAASGSSPSVGGSTVLPSGASAAVGAEPQSKGLFSKGGWLERNGDLVGGTVGGIGQGLIAGLGAKEQADARREAAQIAADSDLRERELISGNYRTSGRGLQTKQIANDNAGRPTPKNRFDPRLYTGRYEWDPALGKIVMKQTA